MGRERALELSPIVLITPITPIKNQTARLEKSGCFCHITLFYISNKKQCNKMSSKFMVITAITLSPTP